MRHTDNVKRKLQLAKIKQTTGWTADEMAGIAGIAPSTMATYVKGTETLVLSDLLNVEPGKLADFISANKDHAIELLKDNGIQARAAEDRVNNYLVKAELGLTRQYKALAAIFSMEIDEAKTFLKHDPAKAAEMLSSITNTKLAVARKRIDDLLAQSADNGLSKIANAPSQEVLDRLMAAIPEYAWAIIHQAARVFADDGLAREDFLKDVDHQLNGFALLAEVGDPGSVTIRINGQPRRIGHELATPSFGHLHHELDGKSLEDCRSAIREKAWDRYLELVVTPGELSIPEKRDLYAKLVRLQGLRYSDLGAYINVSEHTTKKWAVDSEQEAVGGKRYPSHPPADVLEVLAISGLQWASNVVSNALGDSRKKKPIEFQPLVPEEYWAAIARLKPVNAVEIDRGDQPKRGRGRPRKVTA
ncbi:hypothetical protein [Pseudorhizobium flavum]|uniref:hypothetical protein n=1 Tax=Pseudorhizobium flavum TaxID=1335061 RepID=UPI00376FE5D1